MVIDENQDIEIILEIPKTLQKNILFAWIDLGGHSLWWDTYTSSDRRCTKKCFDHQRNARWLSDADALYAYGMEFDGLNPLQRIQMERKFKKLFRLLLSSAPQTYRNL